MGDNSRKEEASKCPIDASQRSSWLSWATNRSSSSSTTTTTSSAGTTTDERNQPASIEEAARHAQTPQPGQKLALATERQVSSIPRGLQTENVAHHQHDATVSNWVYPSEQQMYNAMIKKGWSNVPEDSIPTVLSIHNMINERTWAQILSWEETDSAVLSRFQGRPRDLTPKAFFKSRVLQQVAPFDRHDWYVANPDGSEQRYVIDYYMYPPRDRNMPPIPYIDARPALDSPRGVYLRGKRFLQNAFPGITTYMKNKSN